MSLQLVFNPLTGQFDYVNSTGAGGGQVNSVVAGTGISVDSTDPVNPIVTATGAGTGTVTSVSVVSANGVSGSVATATTTPAITLTLGAIVPTTVNGLTFTGSGTLALGTKNLTISNTLTLAGTDSTTMTFPSTSATIARTDAANTFTGHQTIEGVTTTGATGTGLLVFANTPTLTTAVLGSSTATTQIPADNSTKVATTAYVDAAVLGQNFKEAVKYASTGALPSIVYNNGSSGVGATLTGVALAAISLDSSSPAVNDRVLIKNQVSTFQNGIYTVTATGSGIAVFVLTRATDANQSFEYKTGDSVFVTTGATLASTTWAYTGADSPTIGTDALTYVQTAGQGTVTAGNGITVTGLSVAIDTSITVDKTTVQTLTNKTLTSPTFTSPVLGTPSSGTMTNVTGVPAAAIVAGTFGSGAYSFGTGNAVTLGTIEIGAASDTTVARVSAGVISVEGVTIPSISSTNTLTNKRVTRRISVVTQSATPTTNTDNGDIFQITALAQAITSMTTNLSGTPVDGDLIEFQITDNATARAITWGTSFANGGLVNLPTTTVLSVMLRVLLEYQTTASLNKWVCVAVA